MKQLGKEHIGRKVTFIEPIDRYPFGVIDAGSTGVVFSVGWERWDDGFVYIQLDCPDQRHMFSDWEGCVALHNGLTADCPHADYEGIEVLQFAQSRHG